MHKYHILSTVLLPEEVQPELEQAGLLYEQIPFIKTEAVVGEEERLFIDTISEEKRIVIFTSVKAVKAVIMQLEGKKPEWKMFCISGTTKEAVDHYFGPGKHIIGVAENAGLLAEQIVLFEPDSEPVFFCGNRSLDILPEQLSKQGIRVDRCQVYETVLTPHKVNKKYDALLFFSPSGVESFLVENEIAPGTVLFAIGKTTAKALKDRSANEVIVSPAPGKQQLIQTVIAYYKSTKI